MALPPGLVLWLPARPTDGSRDLVFPRGGSVAGSSPGLCGSWSVRLCQGSQNSGEIAAEHRPQQPPPKMGLLGLLPILVPFILLGGVQEPGLVEGSSNSKYWGLSPPSGEMELCWEEETKNSTHKKCFPPPQPGILGRGQGRYLESSFQLLSSW